MDVTDAVAGGRQRVVGFADVVRIPVRRWRTVAATTAAVVLVTLGYLLFFPATYRATTVVVLRPVVTDPFTLPAGGADRAINMTAENGIALGNEVVDATAQTLGRDADDVRDALSVEVPTGGQVLRFEYAGDTEPQAITGANAAAQTYLKVREAIYQQQRAALLLSYDSTIKQVTSQRKAAQKELPDDGTTAPGPASPRVQAMLDQVSKLNDQLAQLANARAKVSSADLSPGAITAAARTPVPSSHDHAPLYLLAALVGGVLVGVLVAHSREALDRRVRSVEQAADLVGVPALGTVRGGGDGGAAADARYVSLAVLKWLGRHPDRPLIVLSSRDDEGRTAVTGNLAVALAEAGQDVHLAAPAESETELKEILYAAQRRTPPRPRLLPVADPPRLNGVAQPGVGAALPMRPGFARPTGPGLQTAGDPDATMVMEAAVSRPSATPLLASRPDRPADERAALAVLIGGGVVRLRPLGDLPERGVVVVDAPPSDTDERGVRDAQSGVALLVVARDRTRNVELTRLVDRLRSAGAQAVGFVLTGGRRG
ncbi:lipopolysaccharide biosynthesis protein [Krasilnikovia sp. MM14-A1259]|uniref:lipopolysaccharide biosynthesis protein n=1 Tax=Krasilnikovia sp. MM14-A1259 TaxID=3373539 RepID=UPI003818B6C7